jgi:hypothetical protein
MEHINNTKVNLAIMQKISEAVNIAIEQYKAENPDVDVEAIMSEYNRLQLGLGVLQSRELDKFIAYAKEQGTKMSFDAMETGVLAAGRKDMQSGLGEILNSLKFDRPACLECGEELDNRGLSKKKVLTSVGEVEIHPVRFACAIDNGQSVYPLQDFIELIDQEVALSDDTMERQTIKCTRNAAASIALACSESSYEQATLILNRLAGFDLNAVTGFRITDSVGAAFVKAVPAEIDPGKIAEMTEKISGNILEARVNQMNTGHAKRNLSHLNMGETRFALSKTEPPVTEEQREGRSASVAIGRSNSR